MKYQPPFDPTFNGPVDGIYNADPDAGYVNGNPQTGEEGSIPPFESVEHCMREIVHVIEWSGQTPDHEDLEQLRKALRWLTGERLVKSVGGAIAVYAGVDDDDDAHVIRSIEAGSNITLALVESPADSGLHKIRISATAGGGGGAGGDPIVNIGVGEAVYKGNFDDQEQFRTLKGTGGIVVSVGTGDNADTILIDGSNIGGDGDHDTGDVIIRQRHVTALMQSVNTSMNSTTTNWTGTYTPKGASNVIDVKAHLQVGVDSSGALFWVEWRTVGGAWSTLQTKTIESLADGGVNYHPDVLLLGEIAIPATPVPPNNIEIRVRHRAALGGTNYIFATSRVEVVEYQTIA